MSDRAVFTIATGKPLYMQLAANLARSFWIWNRSSNIDFFLATDMGSLVPSDLTFVSVIDLEKNQFGEGFAPKLYLDELAPASQSLFIDADCLCVGSLDHVFDKFSGRPVSVIGRMISRGEWFGDVENLCRTHDVPAIPRFNGGVYYLEPGLPCNRVFTTARALKDRYDALGLVRLRGHENDEILISLGMALNGLEPLAEDGSIMNSTLAAPAGLKIDVLKGESLLKNPRDHAHYNDWYLQEEMNPTLVHFLGFQTGRYPYRHEAIRLRLISSNGWPLWLSTIWAHITFSIPWRIRTEVKNLIRPLFRSLFGTRAVQPNVWDR